MKLYLCQHGHAVAKATDPDRPLSDTGQTAIDQLVDFLKGQDLSVSEIFHSDKTRARQTAELLAEAFETNRPIQSLSDVNPKDDPKIFAVRLANRQNDVLLVSHLPFLSKLASLLVTGENHWDLLTFVPGSIACLESSENNGWSVIWMLRPELLRK